MGNHGTFHRSVTLQTLTVFSLVAVFAADHVKGGDDGCSPFSCGHLQDLSYPFRRQGDPLKCGVEAYELGCASSKAAIHINTGTYDVTAINYTGSYFWVMDTNFDANSSCPLPLWNHLSYSRGGTTEPDSLHTSLRACTVDYLEPYCGYLAMIPFGEGTSSDYLLPQNASHVDITELIKKGFTVQFPVEIDTRSGSVSKAINICLNDSISFFKEQISDASIMNLTRAFFWSDMHFFECVLHRYYIYDYTALSILAAIATPKFLYVLCRFLLAPLALWTFLLYKYWKKRITIDAVEKFLRIQHMMPSRPFFCDEGHIHVEDSYHFTSELTTVSEELTAVSEEDEE
ncbi:hypothetical protein ACQ4PT_014861 [Festuca glaucescens]